jgi:biotin carboxyl carrier protein
MDLRKLKKLIDLVEESSITELEINDAEEKVRIVKNGGAMAHQAYAPVDGRTPAQMMAAAPGATVTVAAPAEPEAAGRRCRQGADGRHFLPRIQSRAPNLLSRLAVSSRLAIRCASLKR